MTLGLEMITVDCTDPATLAQWWAEAVGGSVVPLPGGDFVVVVRESWPALGFQRVELPTPGKNRVHLDFTAADLDSEVHRLVGLGAHRDRPAMPRRRFPLGGHGRSGRQRVLRGSTPTLSPH